MRHSYWSCSPFADWLRGTPKPTAESSSGWRKWRKAAEAKSKFRYWLAEEGLDAIQNFLWWPYDRLNDIRYYVNNRWVTKTHALTAHKNDIKPGQWRDVGNRFLPCMFNELVDFVEIELAASNYRWDDKAKENHNVPRWWRWWRVWRSEECAMKYINWAMELTDEDWITDEEKAAGRVPVLTTQALAAKEIKELYFWWKYLRPLRPDPHDASGWSDLCKRRRSDSADFMWEDANDEERAETRKILDETNRIEQEQTDEDTEMLIRLIRVRDSLWT